MAFTHLHLHTEFSLLDGACRIDRLVQKLLDLGQTSCAITDHGAMYGVVDFYNACREKGIHPIIGCECYICEDMYNKSSGEREYNHLILLCKNETGYKNLSKLVSAAFIDGFYYKPRFDYQLLERHAEGLVALSACIFGKLPQLLLHDRVEEAEAHALYMEGIFGKGNYYIELMNHGLSEELTVLPRLAKLAARTGIPLVATNDCHYLEKSDAFAQEVLMCIKTGKKLEDANRMQRVTDQLYVKSEAEMRELFAAYPEAVDNTARIADMCRYDFDFKTMHLPSYPIESGETPMEMLTRLCMEGLAQYYPEHGKDSAAYQRLMYELDMIDRMGYVDYFLIVWDFIRYARSRNIPVGPGRGSGAGSIVAYTLHITGLDPLQYNLLFERFLNPERLSMPDLDIDFCYERRQEVIDYVTAKYGADRVAQIITFGTMAARGVLRDVGRVLGVPLQKVDRIAKMIPMQMGITLDGAFKLNPDLEQEYQNDDESKRLFDMARLLEGMPRNASTHAAGVLISAKPVVEVVPVQKNDDIVTTQFTMTTLERLGLLKMDFLGLRTLTVIRDTLNMIADEKIQREEDIPLDDENVYTMISKGDTIGVFQLESGGMRVFLHNMKPGCFEDIIAAISLYRPGPMENIPKYLKGKQDSSSVRYITPELKPILSVTYGCMVYQEQVMQIVRDLAGYSLGRSDLVRRAMSKKKHDVMEKEKAYFIHGMQDEDGKQIIDGCLKRGISLQAANEIFDEMSAFASYAFNKSHAAAYAVLSVQTAYLKHYYPVQFMAATLNSFLDATSKVASYIQYCRMNGIRVLPPDINRSQLRFAVEQFEGAACIRFGLGAIKNVGANAIADIIHERESALFRHLYDFIDRMAEKNINKRMVESLIKAGAFDHMGYNRIEMICSYDDEMEQNHARSKKNVRGQLSLFDMVNAEQSSAEPQIARMPEYPKKHMLLIEKETTGIYISGHPLDDYVELLKGYDSVLEMLEIGEQADKGIGHDGKRVKFAGILVSCRKRPTRRGELMGTLVLEDLSAQIEGLVFPKVLARVSKLFEEDNAVEITGRMSYREDEDAKLIVEDMKRLQTEEQAVKAAEEEAHREKLYLRINSTDLDELKRLLLLYPGKSPVLVKLQDTNKALRFDESYWCSVTDDLLDALIFRFGMENIIVDE